MAQRTHFNSCFDVVSPAQLRWIFVAFISVEIRLEALISSDLFKISFVDIFEIFFPSDLLKDLVCAYFFYINHPLLWKKGWLVDISLWDLHCIIEIFYNQRFPRSLLMDCLLYVLMDEEWLQYSHAPTWLNNSSLSMFSIYICYIIYMS